MTELTQAQVQAVLQSAVAHLRTALDADINSPYILVLAAVAQEEGIPQAEIEERVKGLSSTAVSRNLMNMGHLTERRTPGPNLVRQYPNPMNRRQYCVELTDTGRRLLADMTKAVNKKLARLK